MSHPFEQFVRVILCSWNHFFRCQMLEGAQGAWQRALSRSHSVWLARFTSEVAIPSVTAIKMGYHFLEWLRNWLLSAGLEPVLSHTEKSYIASYYRQSSKNIKISHKSITGFVSLWLRPLGANKTSQTYFCNMIR